MDGDHSSKCQATGRAHEDISLGKDHFLLFLHSFFNVFSSFSYLLRLPINRKEISRHIMGTCKTMQNKCRINRKRKGELLPKNEEISG